MNPQNYNQVPQGQPAPQGYGANASARAMNAAQNVARPLNITQTPTPQNTSTPYQQSAPGQPLAPTQSQPTSYPGANIMPPAQPTQPQVQTPQPPFISTQTNYIHTAQPTQVITQPTLGQPAAPVDNIPKVIENPISTQSTLLFSELRDSIVIMKDGSFRAVVACQSINFDLMSETEREGVEYSYQNFLNSLNFTIQILVRSQRVDIGPYIEKLAKMRRNNDNMLLGVLMDDYIRFIDILSQEANIMDKSFFIVIPYYSSPDLEHAVEQTKNFFKAVSRTKAQSVTRINRDIYDKAIDELNNRVESVISGLFQIGIQSVRLNTKELSQLFYNFNNPDTAVREPLVDFTKLATTYVKKGVKE